MIAGRINVALIWAHWSEILRVVASIRTGAVTASVIMRQLAPIRGRTGWRRAREQGRLERTLCTLDWISEPQLRRETGQELNKVRPVTVRRERSSSIGSEKSVTEPMRTRTSRCSSIG